MHRTRRNQSAASTSEGLWFRVRAQGLDAFMTSKPVGEMRSTTKKSETQEHPACGNHPRATTGTSCPHRALFLLAVRGGLELCVRHRRWTNWPWGGGRAILGQDGCSSRGRRRRNDHRISRTSTSAFPAARARPACFLRLMTIKLLIGCLSEMVLMDRMS